MLYDFPNSDGLQRITREIVERGGIVSSVYPRLLRPAQRHLSDGIYLVADRTLTGFAWQEEVLARVNKLVPHNAEKEIQKRGAH